MADVISDVLGKPVRFQQVSFEAFKAGFIERGASKGIRAGHDRHDAGQERGTGQCRAADAREHDSSQFSAVERRGAEAGGSQLIELTREGRALLGRRTARLESTSALGPSASFRARAGHFRFTPNTGSIAALRPATDALSANLLLGQCATRKTEKPVAPACKQMSGA
jgi:hypothetical protein